MLKKAIVGHIESVDVIPDTADGFRSGRSSETAMLAALNDGASALDRKIKVTPLSS